jgi:hypothetical protein
MSKLKWAVQQPQQLRPTKIVRHFLIAPIRPSLAHLYHLYLRD